jgi:hypothetical protein
VTMSGVDLSGFFYLVDRFHLAPIVLHSLTLWLLVTISYKLQASSSSGDKTRYAAAAVRENFPRLQPLG